MFDEDPLMCARRVWNQYTICWGSMPVSRLRLATSGWAHFLNAASSARILRGPWRWPSMATCRYQPLSSSLARAGRRGGLEEEEEEGREILVLGCVTSGSPSLLLIRAGLVTPTPLSRTPALPILSPYAAFRTPLLRRSLSSSRLSSVRPYASLLAQTAGAI